MAAVASVAVSEEVVGEGTAWAAAQAAGEEVRAAWAVEWAAAAATAATAARAADWAAAVVAGSQRAPSRRQSLRRMMDT